MANKWMSQLTKDFGKVASEMAVKKESIISMPSPSLNWAVGNGGILEGKALCLYGPESGGKSLLMQLMIKEIQRRDPEAIAVLFDAEYSFNSEWFRKLGGDPDRLYVRQTNDPLKIFDYIATDLLSMIQDGMPVKALAIDSVKSILYPKDQKKQTTDLTMGGGGASYLGPALKLILPVIREHNLTTLMVQQVYEELDPMKALANPYKVPDGRALKHFCDYMLEVTRIENKASKLFDDSIAELGSKTNKMQVGHAVKVKVKKNRCGAPYRTAIF
ncbi:MAG: DNA recombination/repair protein RecA [Leptolyngbyaceae cyanobacterium RM2_2_4]|nr:DNA recombination/repair protein RecA [Leptolyngbyaceae cyanobacterium RM2_2_4]